MYCGKRATTAAASTGGWFVETRGRPGTFCGELRPRPGCWAVSFMDLSPADPLSGGGLGDVALLSFAKKNIT